MKGTAGFVFLALVCVAQMLSRAPAVSAATCDPMQLTPCAAAIGTSALPSALCCSRLKQQQPCFCQYAKNPNLQKYINSANSRKVSDACKVPFPKC